jgi:hypothetical protein
VSGTARWLKPGVLGGGILVAFMLYAILRILGLAGGLFMLLSGLLELAAAALLFAAALYAAGYLFRKGWDAAGRDN